MFYLDLKVLGESHQLRGPPLPLLSSLSSPTIPSSPLPFLPLHSPLEVGAFSRALECSSGIWGSAVSSPSGVRGRAPAKIDFYAIIDLKMASGGNDVVLFVIYAYKTFTTLPLALDM